MRHSLRTKIVAWSTIPTAIILVFVAMLSLRAYERVTEDLVIERDREVTHLAADLLAHDLASYTDPLSEHFMASFDGMVAFSATGKVLAAEPEQYERWTPKWFPDVSLYQVLRSSEPVFSDVVAGQQPNEKLIAVIMPLRSSEGELQGGIAGIFSLDATQDSTLSRAVAGLRRSEGSLLYLVDGAGQVIYHSRPEHVGADFSEHAAVKQVLLGRAGSYRTRSLEGDEIVASFAPVSGTSWGLVTEESWAALTAPQRRYGCLFAILLIMGVVLPSVAVALGVRRITQPIGELIGAAQEIASGRFGRRIQTHTGDEVEQLAMQFNRMADQLQQSYAHLEQKVADRTRGLSALNAIATEVSQSLDQKEILTHALDRVLEVTGRAAGQAFALDGDGSTLMPVVHKGFSEGLAAALAHQSAVCDLRIPAVLEGRPVVVGLGDLPQGPVSDFLSKEGLSTMVRVPLMVHGKLVGAVDVAGDSPCVLTSDDEDLLAAMGHQIGIALENARLYDQAQELAVVKERNRLARDLHDSVTQALYALALYSEAASRQLQAGDVGLALDHLTEIRETAQSSLREMRLLIFELRLPTLSQEGLVVSVQARLDAVEGRVGVATHFWSNLEGRLDDAVEEGLYRIAQEALNNTLRHAEAKSVSVRLQAEDGIVSLDVSDDGCGFDLDKVRHLGGFGLDTMRERAACLGADLVIQSHPGHGTSIRVEVAR